MTGSKRGNLQLLRWVVLAGLTIACVGRGASTLTGNSDWRVTGGDPGNSRYSSLDQINRANVSSLRVAWIYHTGDSSANSQIQATPLIVDGVLYTTTPALAVVALRAESGTRIWRFDPFASRERDLHVNRGAVYWSEGSERRIFFSAGRRLYSLDASTGRPIPSFGDSGWVDLAAGLGRDIGDAYIVATSPGVIYQDILIQGTRVGEEEGSAPGDVRAYDVRTGKIRWTFHTIPRPGELGYDTWPADAWKTAGKPVDTVACIDAAAFARQLGKGISVLDVRKISEAENGHLGNALVIPFLNYCKFL